MLWNSFWMCFLKDSQRAGRRVLMLVNLHGRIWVISCSCSQAFFSLFLFLKMGTHCMVGVEKRRENEVSAINLLKPYLNRAKKGFTAFKMGNWHNCKWIVVIVLKSCLKHGVQSLGKLLTPYMFQISFGNLGICIPQKTTSSGVWLHFMKCLKSFQWS